MPDLTVYEVIIYRHIVSLTSLTKTTGTIEHADSITIFTILLFIYLHSHWSKKVWTPPGYRTSLNELNVNTKQLQRRITINTLLQDYIKSKIKLWMHDKKYKSREIKQ